MDELVFGIAGFLIVSYAAYLIHKKVDVNNGHTLLIIAGVVVFFMPLLQVKLSPDGDAVFALSSDVAATNDGAQTALAAVNDIQERLKSLAAQTEARLTALENPGSSAPPDTAPPLPEVVQQPPDEKRAIEEQQKALEKAEAIRDLRIEERKQRIGAY